MRASLRVIGAHQDRLIRWALVVVSSALILLAGLGAAGVRYNHTPSVPVGLYLVRDFALEDIARGTYVCFRPWADQAPRAARTTRWAAEKELMLKRVAGTPGDEVTQERGAVAVNGMPVAHSSGLARDSTGRALPHPTYPVHLAGDELWLASTHDAGYDSRYFGPVRAAALSCVAEPLWLF